MTKADEYTFTLSVVPVGNFCFRQDRTVATLNIKDDITPLESANLSVLMVQAVVSSGYAFAYIDFINEKKLDRHFVIKIT